MSNQDHTTTTPGAVDANRGMEKRTVSGTGDPTWSGVSSGAEGVMPQGAAVGGTQMGASSSQSSSGSMEDQVKSQTDKMKGKADQALGKADQMASQTDKVLSTASSKAHQAADQAASKADMGMDKAAGGLDTLAGTLREKGQSTGNEKASSISTMAADKLESGASMLRSQDSDQLIMELESLVRRKPVESMLVAAGVGFVLSKALR